MSNNQLRFDLRDVRRMRLVSCVSQLHNLDISYSVVRLILLGYIDLAIS